MDETNGLEVIIGADVTDLRQGFSEAERIVQQGSARIQSSIQDIGNIGQQLAGLGATLTASITLPLVALGTAAVKAYGDLQALELGIEAVAGSAQFAGKQMAELREIAKLPGLGLKEAAKGSVGLQAIGYSAGNAEKILLQFGNAIATVGKGRQDFERAIYGVQQLANTDFPLGEDLNIIKDALPQVSTLLKAAFGTSRTEDLQKLKVSSKQVMDVIITGLEKLPRVSGGIKNAFENLGDSMQQNLARIGKLIDDNFNISGIIDKLTNLLDDVITAFEELSPPMQKTILIVVGITAAIGPLLLAIGGFLALVPVIVSGITAIGTAITATIAFMTSWVGIIAGLIVAAAALGAGIAYLATRQTEAEENQERWNKSMAKATAAAQSELSALDALYKKTQDQSLAMEERNKAVDQLQKEYPGYLGNLSDEAIKAGNAANAYNELRKGILNASLARAAQAELDKRNEVRLNKELAIRERLNKVMALYKDPSLENFAKLNAQLDKGFLGLDVADRLNPDKLDAEGIKKAAANMYFGITKELKSLGNDFAAANKDLFDKIQGGADAIKKLDVTGPDTFLPGLEKVKKETQKQVAEIFPKGSIAELQQRADLLKKSIDTSVNDLVKIRGLDKFGKDVNKAGEPIFTGETLQLEEAKKRFEQLSAQISLLEIKPPSGTSELKQFRDSFKAELEEISNIGKDVDFSLGGSNPFDKLIENISNLGISALPQISAFKNALGTELTDLRSTASSNLLRIGEDFIYFPTTLALGINSALIQAERIKKLKEDINNSLSQLINSSLTDGITDAFSALGNSIATGENALKSVGKAIISTLGNFLQQFGMQLIKTALLSEVFAGLIIAIQNAFGNPYVLLALGAAAVILGSVLTGSVKNTASTAGGGGGNISSASGTGVSSNFSSSNFSGGSSGGEYVFRLSGSDLVATFNRNVSSEDRVSAN